MPGGRKKGRKKKAPALVIFTKGKNEDGQVQCCVYAKCEFSDCIVGPIWSHSEQAVKRALATLTEQCDCPARFHRAHEYRGHRVILNRRRS